MKRLVVVAVLILGSFSLAHAQCSMCRAAAESNIEAEENQRARGLNSGILYLMSIPYVMGGVAGILWWKYRKASTGVEE